jgi:hypothetical protein
MYSKPLRRELRMKKVLALLVVLLFATSAFAVVGTETKLLSQAGLPAELTTDNIIISNTFINKIADFGQLAGLEYLGAAAAYTVLNTGLGVIGISMSPTMGMQTGIGGNYPNYMFGLDWVADASGSGLGIGILIGMQNTNAGVVTKNTGYNNDPDSTYDNRALLGLKAGITLSGVDLGLGLNWLNNSTDWLNHYDPSGNISEEDLTSRGEMDINLGARMQMAEMLWVLKAAIDLGGETDTTHIDGNNDGNFTDGTDTNTVATNSQSNIDVTLLLGKIIKASESLKITIGTGVDFNTYATIQTTFENKNGGNTIYGPAQTEAYTYITVPLYVAVEGKLNETWRINGGVKVTPLYIDLFGYNDRANNTDKTTGKNMYNTGDLNVASLVNFAVGVTGVIGDLQLDLDMNPGILLNGPDFISGNGPGSLAYTLAMIYSWK